MSDFKTLPEKFAILSATIKSFNKNFAPNTFIATHDYKTPSSTLRAVLLTEKQPNQPFQ